MTFQLEYVVPWGRLLREYTSMFDLTPTEMKGPILDCAGGPSSFTAEMFRHGNRVTACDPIYQCSVEDLAQRIEDTYQKMIEGAEAQKENFIWKDLGSPQQLGQIRMQAMRQFLEDFPAGKRQGRYVVGALPTSPFVDRAFGLALCSHFLFTYSDQFSTEFHLHSIIEMCRVATEVRIFPLVTQFSAEPSPHLGPVVTQLEKRGYRVETRQVAYEFQKGGNRLLIVKVPR